MIYAFHSRFAPALRLAMLICAVRCEAYPEFHKVIVESSGRPVNCALCHAHPDGPQGTDVGQLGRLTPLELDRLAQARAALEPGRRVDNPILNAFGNRMVESLGKNRLAELRAAPSHLASQLPKEGDLDMDGILDRQEVLDGTHPLQSNDGHPWLLFKHNLAKEWQEIAMTVIATLTGLYGLFHLLHGVSKAIQRPHDHQPNSPE